MSGDVPAPVRVALIGCGTVSELYYVPALGELEREGLLQLRMLVDSNVVQAQRFNACFPSAQVQKDLAGLSGNTIDFAIVASPPRFHAAQTIALLRAGIPVLCEKPMAVNTAEAEAMIAAAEASGCVLAIGLVRRFLPACQTIRTLLAQSVLGDVQSFHFMEGSGFHWPTQSIDYFQRDNAGGGVLLDIGSHLLDLTSWWMGEPSELRYEDDAMGGIDVNCCIEMKFQDGFTGVLRLSRDCELQSRCFIRGSKGWLSWSINRPEELQLQFNGMTTVVVGCLHEQSPISPSLNPGRGVRNFEQSFVAQLRNVAAAVRGEESPLVSGQEGLKGMQLLDKCLGHTSLMPLGWLNEQERARAASLAHGVSK
jgi:predicted dehydrogenase